ncbi:MAG: heme ABC transporter ATP-binding protein [Candidatus Rokuibacteriota bacterium]|nr:MAG: heme ABC transporter ATP-binding protein [Candidatus Rokubacteria bacterium]
MASRPAEAAPPLIELRGIDKRFGGVHANRDVSLVVHAGTVHGIVGENGAGKSTLMGILYGYHQPDRGEIRLRGRRATIRSAQHALAAGIGMVHQHFMLVEPFTVLENVVLGVEGGFRLGAGMRRARAEMERLGREYHLEVDPDARVADLGVGQRQRVEILKALYRGADVLILDEPTAVLTPQEADHLFRILGSLRNEGKTVLLITHKLREIREVTDVVTVMRQGRVVRTLRTAETTPEGIAELMVGRAVSLRVEKAPREPGEPVLEVKDLIVEDGLGVQRVKGVSFAVRRGEVVGIAGVAGNGQSELLEAIAGMRAFTSGQLCWKSDVADTDVRTPRGMRQLGVGHVPEDRQRVGLITSFAARESAILGHHADPGYNGAILQHGDAVAASFRRQAEDYDIRPREGSLPTRAFSGGNQQKVVLARELDRNPDLLLVGQPTRGVDIGAIEFIHRRLVALRDAGKAILLVSVELDEVLALSDRILVMHDGRIVGEVTQAEATERTLGLMMAGVAQARSSST